MRWVGTLLLGALLALAAPAEAQRARRGNDALATAVQHLEATDPAEVRGAIEALGILGDARAAEPIAARIRRGLPPELLDAAIDALTVLGRPEAGPVLFELASHRRPAVRLKAVLAIAATRPRGADRALTAALADSDPAVRGAAASGLAESARAARSTRSSTRSIATCPKRPRPSADSHGRRRWTASSATSGGSRSRW